MAPAGASLTLRSRRASAWTSDAGFAARMSVSAASCASALAAMRSPTTWRSMTSGLLVGLTSPDFTRRGEAFAAFARGGVRRDLAAGMTLVGSRDALTKFTGAAWRPVQRSWGVAVTKGRGHHYLEVGNFPTTPST